MDVKLNEDDLATVVEELHPVRHKSRLLGVLLGLPNARSGVNSS